MKTGFHIRSVIGAWALALGVGVICWCIMVWWGTNSTANAVVRDETQLFGMAMGSPLMLVFPLAPVLAGCLTTASLVSHRFVSQFWVRRQMLGWLFQHLGATSLRIFVVFFLVSLSLFAFAQSWWPALQPGVLDPAGYGITPDNAAYEVVTRFTFSQMLAAGPYAFGVGFSALIGAQATLYCALGQAFIFLTGRPVLGMAIPTILYFAESAVAGISGTPSLGLMYVLVPFGLIQTPLWHAGIALGLLAVGTFACWAFVLIRRNNLSSLA